MADPLRAFVCTDFEGFYPVGTAAIVYARNEGQARNLLRIELLNQGLGKDDPANWTFEEVTPHRVGVHVLRNGDY